MIKSLFLGEGVTVCSQILVYKNEGGGEINKQKVTEKTPEPFRKTQPHRWLKAEKGLIPQQNLSWEESFPGLLIFRCQTLS
jgi:hypothetical protein